MKTLKTTIAALLILGTASAAMAAGPSSDAWMNRASQSYSGGGY